MWSARRTPEGAENTLRKGISLIAFDIRNLFFFLPCSFYLKDLNENLLDKIFEVNERMIQLDDSEMGKVRMRLVQAGYRGAEAVPIFYGIRMAIELKPLRLS